MTNFTSRTLAVSLALALAAACAANKSDDNPQSTGATDTDPSSRGAGDAGIGGPTPPIPYPGQEGPPSVIDGVSIPTSCQNPGFPGGDQHVDFNALRSGLLGQKPAVESRQAALLAMRYDLAERPSPTIRMTRGKPIEIGVRVRLPKGQTWQSLASMTPDQIRESGLFPPGFMVLPHPNHALGGQLFAPFLIDELNAQTGGFRDLTRFDLDLDLPRHLLPEFPPAMFLINHEDLGDVSQGQLVTIENFYELFKNILNPKELEGLRLLVTPTPQQEFNLIDDRRSNRPSLGVACFDCHANGHTTGSIENLPDDRPQPMRRRGDTVSLRGLANEQIFGSKRAFETVEHFSEFEEHTAYFDGDITQANKKGFVPIDIQFQLPGMAEVQRLLDFPPAPKLDLEGHLDPAKATAQELRGEALFNGKAQCASCHPAPYYLDNQLHDLHIERFVSPQLVNCRLQTAEGPIKAFTLRGIKESPPYLHDGRLLTLEDTIEFFNLILQVHLTDAEKTDLLTFLYTL